MTTSTKTTIKKPTEATTPELKKYVNSTPNNIFIEQGKVPPNGTVMLGQPQEGLTCVD